MTRLFQHVSGEKLRDHVFLPYLRGRRWFAAREAPVTALRARPARALEGRLGHLARPLIDAHLASGEVQRYFLPLALDWESRNHDPLEKYEAFTVTKLRHKDRVGIVYAAFADPRFSRDLARAMGANAEVALGPGRLRFSSNALFAPLAGAIDEDVRTPALEQSNTAVFFGNRLFLKAYRRLRDGVNPELEMGRFLTEASPYPHVAPIVGAVEYVEDGGEPVTLAVMQKFVENQGDLWTVTLEHLTRLLIGPDAGPQAAAENAAAGFHLGRMALLGRRVAEMHAALAKVTGDPAFDPEPVTAEDVALWKDDALREIDAAVEALGAATPNGARLTAVRDRLRERVANTCRPREGGDPISGLKKSRFHGDLHLGQVIVAKDDFVIVDFEGEPGRPLERRRRKSCVLRDVAGMLRSFSYAAHAALLKRERAPREPMPPRARSGMGAHAARHFVEGSSRPRRGSDRSRRSSFGELIELSSSRKPHTSFATRSPTGPSGSRFRSAASWNW